jgi:hypothetical protein
MRAVVKSGFCRLKPAPQLFLLYCFAKKTIIRDVGMAHRFGDVDDGLASSMALCRTLFSTKPSFDKASVMTLWASSNFCANVPRTSRYQFAGALAKAKANS